MTSTTSPREELLDAGVDSSLGPVGGLFDATHREFAGWYPRLWGPLGALASSVARPAAGERVLDACCGSGASAVPAAQAVGPGGHVDAVDLAPALLDQGRDAARSLGLSQLRFVNADVTTWRPEDGAYDLVQCCYGVFFFPELDAGATHLVDLLRPGGRLAVTTWVEGGMDTIVRTARTAALKVRPEPGNPSGAPDPRTRMNTADRLGEWLTSLGLADVEVHQVEFRQPLLADDAWMFFLGAAPRRFLAGMDADQVARVRELFYADLAENRVTHLDASTLIGVGIRPGERAR